MSIRTTNTSTITTAVQTLLRAALPYAQGELIVERAEPINAVPGRCPWVGIYRQSVRAVPRTLGLSSGYRRQEVSLALVMTESSSQSGELCEEKLEELVQNVLSAVLSDESLLGTVDSLGDVHTIYRDYRKEGNSYFQEAVIQFTALVNVTAL